MPGLPCTINLSSDFGEYAVHTLLNPIGANFLIWNAMVNSILQTNATWTLCAMLFCRGIQEECDVFRLTHNAAYKPGHGKANVAFNGAVPPRDTNFVWGDFQFGTRLPFTAEKVAERNSLVATFNPRTKMEVYLYTREANALLLGELLRY